MLDSDSDEQYFVGHVSYSIFLQPCNSLIKSFNTPAAAVKHEIDKRDEKREKSRERVTERNLDREIEREREREREGEREREIE